LRRARRHVLRQWTHARHVMTVLAGRVAPESRRSWKQSDRRAAVVPAEVVGAARSEVVRPEAQADLLGVAVRGSRRLFARCRAGRRLFRRGNCQFRLSRDDNAKRSLRSGAQGPRYDCRRSGERRISITDVVRATYYLADAADWHAVGPVLGETFDSIRPAATGIVTGLVTPEMKIEIEVTAFGG